MKLVSKLAVVVALVSVVSCSTSPKTQVVQLGDNQLTKSQIEAEWAKLDQTEKKIDSKKGITATNVAAVVFFWPGLAFTYFDAYQATKSVEERRAHLAQLYNQQLAEQAKTNQKAA